MIILDKNCIRTKDDLLQYKQIMLYGAGHHAVPIITWLGSKVCYIVDTDENKWGIRVCGVPVIAPDVAFVKKNVGGMNKDTAILISSAAFQYEIAKSIEKYDVPITQIFAFTNSSLELLRYKPEDIFLHQQDIQHVLNCLADDESKEYFVNYINAIITRNPFYYKNNPNVEECYQYKAENRTVKLRGGELIFDCGAYNGDTAKLFLNQTGGNCEMFCFEPFEDSFNELQEWIEKEHINNVRIYKIALGKEKQVGTIFGDAIYSVTQSLDNKRFDNIASSQQVEIDSIDNIACNLTSRSMFIKMDIEGQEVAALLGASRTIQRFRPTMIISAYHKLEDIWEIPQTVLDIAPDYLVYFGHQPNVPLEPEFIFVLKEYANER
ncbi:MAG: hypothetical protein Ta2B_17320 [Termitinemataceae bacterium]|nr:MAG: hypothetical protein Ta2B_17320 [Termitinemataceae bacterium]